MCVVFEKSINILNDHQKKIHSFANWVFKFNAKILICVWYLNITTHRATNVCVVFEKFINNHYIPSRDSKSYLFLKLQKEDFKILFKCQYLLIISVVFRYNIKRSKNDIPFLFVIFFKVNVNATLISSIESHHNYKSYKYIVLRDQQSGYIPL